MNRRCFNAIHSTLSLRVLGYCFYAYAENSQAKNNITTERGDSKVTKTNAAVREVTIGNTTYVVNCYCSLKQSEIKSKIEHLIKNDAKKNAA